MRQVTINLK